MQQGKRTIDLLSRLGGDMSNLSWITLLAFVLSVAFCIGFRELAREWYLIDIPD